MPTTLPLTWQIRGRSLSFGRPLIMGIVNVTPDSFSDGGQFLDPSRAIEHGMQLVAEGADLLDIGGESTRPGSMPVPADEELRRVVPVVVALASKAGVPVSVDTMKPAVARVCLDAGAAIVNDVTGLVDPEMVTLVRDHRAGAIVMHMQSTPQDMQTNPQYGDVVSEIGAFFESLLQKLTDAGIDLQRVALDPGIGFGKRDEHNWQLIDGLASFQRFGRPVVLGVSRKSFLGKDVPPADRVPTGLAIARRVAAAGSVQVIRTHDVAATQEAIRQIQSHDPQC